MKKQFLLDEGIYDKEVILEWIEDFSEVCAMELSDSHVLYIEAEGEDEADELFHEFMNYVISL